MAMAAELGLEIDLSLLPAPEGLSDLKMLFSESTGRMVVTVAPERQSDFEFLLEGVDWSQVGRVTRPKRLVITSGSQTRADLEISGLRRAFNKRFGKLV
jgi:phosphoribosylformylglycinamidine synthase